MTHNQKPHPHKPRVGHPKDILRSDVPRWYHARVSAAHTGLPNRETQSMGHPPVIGTGRRGRLRMESARSTGFRRWILLASLNYGACQAVLLVLVGLAAKLTIIMTYFVPFILPGVALASATVYVMARQRAVDQ